MWRKSKRRDWNRWHLKKCKLTVVHTDRKTLETLNTLNLHYSLKAFHVSYLHVGWNSSGMSRKLQFLFCWAGSWVPFYCFHKRDSDKHKHFPSKTKFTVREHFTEWLQQHLLDICPISATIVSFFSKLPWVRYSSLSSTDFSLSDLRICFSLFFFFFLVRCLWE